MLSKEECIAIWFLTLSIITGALPDLPKAKVVTMAQVGVVRAQQELNKDETREALKSFFQQRTQ